MLLCSYTPCQGCKIIKFCSLYFNLHAYITYLNYRALRPHYRVIPSSQYQSLFHLQQGFEVNHSLPWLIDHDITWHRWWCRCHHIKEIGPPCMQHPKFFHLTIMCSIYTYIPGSMVLFIPEIGLANQMIYGWSSFCSDILPWMVHSCKARVVEGQSFEH